MSSDPRTHDRMWWFLRRTVGALAWVMFRPRVTGAANVPRSGPALIVSNHQSLWDIPVVGISQGRTLRYMAKSELWKVRPFGAFIAAGGAFPVRRGEPDRDAFRTVHETMVNGGVVGVFIEGHRQAQLAEAKAGAGRIAVVEAVPVVPVAIRGTRGWRPGHRAHVVFGTPRSFERGDRRPGDAYRDAADQLMDEITRMYESLPS